MTISSRVRVKSAAHAIDAVQLECSFGDPRAQLVTPGMDSDTIGLASFIAFVLLIVGDSIKSLTGGYGERDAAGASAIKDATGRITKS